MSRRTAVVLLGLTLVSAAGLGACGGGADGGNGAGGDGAATPTESAYVAPASQPSDDGWETYPAAAMVDGKAAT